MFGEGGTASETSVYIPRLGSRLTYPLRLPALIELKRFSGVLKALELVLSGRLVSVETTDQWAAVRFQPDS